VDPEELKYNALSQIAYGRNRHGYGIAEAINQRLACSLKPAKLYPLLAQFVDEGWTTVKHIEDSRAGPGKHVHTITKEGHDQLLILEKSLEARLARIGRAFAFARAHRNGTSESEGSFGG
jgi:DNA-binding PadR family transcriptional regulator